MIDEYNKDIYVAIILPKKNTSIQTAYNSRL